MKAGRPAARRRPLVPPRLVAAVLAGHASMGVVAAALIYLVCLSGTIAVFAHEIARWEQPAGPVLTTLAPGALDRALREIRARSPVLARETLSLELPSAERPRFLLTAGMDEGVGGEAWVADADGVPVAPAPRAASDFVLRLHAGLLMGGAGGVLVGLAGLMLLALIVSGVLAHPRMIRDAFVFRPGGSARLRHADFHNRIGTWGLPFHLLIAFTGALLGLFFLILAGVAATTHRGDLRGAFADIVGPLEGDHAMPIAVPPLAAIVAEVRRRAPGIEVQLVQVDRIGTRDQTVTVLAHRPGALFLADRFGFGGDARLVFATDDARGSAGRQALLSVQPLHFGWYGGLPIKLAYGLLGVSLCVLTASGMRVWLAKRRARGLPTGMHEALWTATAWGQPAAVALGLLLATCWRDGWSAMIGWLVGTGAACLWAARLSRRGAPLEGLRIFTGLLFGALAVTHAAVWRAAMADPAGWAVDAALVAIAVAVLATGPWPGRPVAEG